LITCPAAPTTALPEALPTACPIAPPITDPSKAFFPAFEAIAAPASEPMVEQPDKNNKELRHNTATFGFNILISPFIIVAHYAFFIDKITLKIISISSRIMIKKITPLSQT